METTEVMSHSNCAIFPNMHLTKHEALSCGPCNLCLQHEA